VSLVVMAVGYILYFEESDDLDAETISGSCGNNLTYTIDLDNGTLTIEGSGVMKDYLYPPWYSYRDSLSTLILNSGLTYIGENAFLGCRSFTGTLSIPSTVTSIGNSAFQNSGFTGSLSIPSGITSIGNYAFAECDGFRGDLNLPTSVHTIGQGAFYHCYGFKGSLTIPSSVTSIGTEAFCETAFTGTLTIPSSFISVGENVFKGCSGFSELILSDNISFIANGMFYGCSGLKGTLTLPSSVTTIGNEAFCKCTGFTGTLYIAPGVSIGGSTFYGCTGFTELNLSPGVDFIGSFAFKGCTGFTGDLTIPSSLTSIGNEAFRGCTGFNGELILPSGIQTIGIDAFNGCSGFTGDLLLPSSITTIGEGAFHGCSGFTGNLSISSKVTIIDYRVFKDCSGFKGTLSIPSSVKDIATEAFYGCSGFTGDLVIPSSVTHFGNYAFAGCTGFTGTLSISSNAEYISGNLFAGCTGFTGTLSIPSGISSIGGSAFYGCSGFTGVLSIPSSVQRIDSNAFYCCNGFSSLILSSGLKEIGGSAFAGCSGFSGTLSLPSGVSSIGKDAFYGCLGFTGNLIVPDSMVAIAANTFGMCSGFTGKLFIPSSICFIGKTAFFGCTGFTSVTLEEGVQGIDYEAFFGWTFYDTDGSTVIASLNDLPGHSYAGSTEKMVKQADAQKFSVTYDIDGGSAPAPTKNPVSEGSSFAISSYSGDKEGFVFGGWTYDGSTYRPGTTFTMPAANVVFKAIWNETSLHTVTYKLDGGSGSIPSQQVEEGKKFTITSVIPTKEGYSFEGWLFGGTVYQSNAQMTMGNTDIELVAKWNTLNEYILSYDVAGGTGSVSSKKVIEGTSIKLASYDGTKSGYSFGGWQFNGFIYQPGTSFTMPAKNVNFVAIWNDGRTHSVIYDLNGGSGTISSQNVVEGATFTVSSSIPMKNGYSFDGWLNGGQNYKPGTKLTMGAEDIILMAQWVALAEYTITYDLNGGSGIISPTKTYEGETVQLSLYNGTKAEYTFRGWQYNGTTYQPGSSFTMPSNDVIFEAIWSKSTVHSISYDLNGGSGSVPSQMIEEGKAFTITTVIPTKSGSSFSGWECDGAVYESGSAMTMGQSDITFIAKWSTESGSQEYTTYIIVAALVSIIIIIVAVMLVKNRVK